MLVRPQSKDVDVQEWLSRLQSLPAVEYVHPNAAVHILSSPSGDNEQSQATGSPLSTVTASQEALRSSEESSPDLQQESLPIVPQATGSSEVGDSNLLPSPSAATERSPKEVVPSTEPMSSKQFPKEIAAGVNVMICTCCTRGSITE